MKCPECGFECLPDDLECLACGINIAAAAENKEKERIRSIEAAERKAKYEIEFKKELGLLSDDEKQTVDRKSATLEETFKKKLTCPKCGAERHAKATDCLRCGIIFEKWGAPVQESGEAVPRQSPVGDVASGPSVQMDENKTQNAIPPEDKTKEIDLKDLEVVDKSKDSSPESVFPPETLQEEEQPKGPEPTGSMVERKQETPVETEKPVFADLETSSEPGIKPEDQETSMSTGQAGVFEDNDKTEIISLKQFNGPKKTVSPAASNKDKFRAGVSQVYNRIVPSMHKTRDGLRTFLKNKRNISILAALVIVLALALMSTFGVSYYDHLKTERVKREHAEKLEKIRLDFVTRKDDISNKIRALILNKLFENAENEIALYDIPALQNDLQPLKNYLKEMTLFEKAKKIPGREFENNYKAFLELYTMAPDNEVYLAKANSYKSKLAEREYNKAKAYVTSKNKSVDNLEQALDYINKSIELFPGSKKFMAVKKTLMAEKLLYYDGNDNILMAVRDDGMGKKLFSNQRKLTIWLKNISQETVYINVQYFTMIGKDNKSYTYNDMGKKFKSKLSPGEQSIGELYFRTRTRPKKLIFNHLIKGEISRVFP